MNLKKLALVSSLTISTLVAGGFATHAIAATFYTDVIYYSDASYTSEVGETITFCNRKRTSWGTTTVYKRTVEQYNCAFPAP